METEGTVKDFVKDSIEDAVKENNKGATTAYNTYVNKGRYSVRFRAFILAI